MRMVSSASVSVARPEARETVRTCAFRGCCCWCAPAPFRLAVLLLQVGERHVQRFMTAADSDAITDRDLINFQIAVYPLPPGRYCSHLLIS